MEIGLRFLAYIIDCSFCFFSILLVFMASGWALEHSGPFALLLMPFWLTAFIVWPFFYFGVFTGIWGRTPGRWICRLKVTHVNGQPPGLWRGLGRETLKMLALASGIGAMFCLYQVLHQGTTWYDQVCETEVEHTPWVRLTATQRKRLNNPYLSGRVVLGAETSHSSETRYGTAAERP